MNARHLRWFLALIFLLCSCDGHWEEYERVIGYRGKARLNPFLAAERMLTDMGHTVESKKSFAQLPSHEAVIFLSGEGIQPEARARQILRWVFSGGHLVYSLSGTRPYNDYEVSFGSFLTALMSKDLEDPILKQLGIEVDKRFPTEEAEALLKKTLAEKSKKEDAAGEKPDPNLDDEDSWLQQLYRVRFKGQDYALSLGGRYVLSLKRDLQRGEFSAGSQKESLALHLHHGMGTITVLSHARPLRNHWIGEHDHAAWLSALVGQDQTREVWWVAASAGSFWGMLWQRAGMAVLAFAACLVFWLWLYMPRFGPKKEVAMDATRHFASHIGALGEFFWRLRRSDLLVQATRVSVWQRVQEKHRALDDGSRKVSDQLAAHISQRTGLLPERVVQVLEMPPPSSAHQFVSHMRDLQAIRRAL